MDDQTTKELEGGSFEERVFAQLQALSSTVSDLSSTVSDLFSAVGGIASRLERLEARAYDTKPIWEQALKEIVETRRELSKRLDRIDAIVHENRADIRDAEDRIEKLERKPMQ
jgi:chromosome segregation ATPase